jgi:hypothetical protein
MPDAAADDLGGLEFCFDSDTGTGTFRDAVGHRRIGDVRVDGDDRRRLRRLERGVQGGHSHHCLCRRAPCRAPTDITRATARSAGSGTTLSACVPRSAS